MKDEDVYERLSATFERLREALGLETVHDGLIAWFALNFLSQDDQTVADRIVIDSQAEGVDAIIVDEVEKAIFFIQAKGVQDFKNAQKAFPEGEIKKFTEGCRFLIRGSYRGKISPDLENLVDEYHTLDSTGNYQTFALVLSMKGPPDSTKFLESLSADLKQIKWRFVGFKDLASLYEKEYLPRQAGPPEKISFEVVTNVLSKDEPHRARVFTCKAKELAKAYNDNPVRLLQQNVRFLVKSPMLAGVNSQIRETATDAALAPSFWYYNNGITFVCKKLHVTNSEKLISLFEPQLINGAQTTLTLHQALQDGTLIENAEILVRVIETTDPKLMEKITLYSNSQNAIRLRDLLSNESIQGQIQKTLLDAYGVFFERKRGEFHTTYPTEEAKTKALGAGYRDFVISNERAAQAFLAFFSDKPAQAKNQKGRIFARSNGFYDEVFDTTDDLLPEKLWTSWELLRFVDRLKRQYRKEFTAAKGKSKAEQAKVFARDFVLHSEYFVLNLLHDMVVAKGLLPDQNRKALANLASLARKTDAGLVGMYDSIVQALIPLFSSLRKDKRYYHNRFFKNENSLGTVRAHVNGALPAIQVLASPASPDSTSV